MKESLNYERYSEALRDLFMPRIMEIADKPDLTAEDCQKAVEMFRMLEKALQQERYGEGLF